jgi:predicted  nucleic acid-binding Zn-ribbon protein
MRLEKLKKANSELQTKLESCMDEMSVIKEDLQKEMDRPHHARERLKGK